jgi:DNA repair exonuclease SbcCD nuclease subunit
MRILHLGDTHLGQHLPAWGSPPDWHRSQDHQRAFQAAMDFALRGEVDLVLHTGDLFDGKAPAPSVVSAALEVLTEAARRVPVLLIPGNHDTPLLRRCLGELPAGLQVCEEPARVRILDLVAVAMPFLRSPEDWCARAAEIARDGADLLVHHQALSGCWVPGFTFRPGRPQGTLAPEELPSQVPVLLGGHLHPHQAFHIGRAESVYAGSTERTAFSEVGQPKGCVLWDWGASPRWRFHVLPSRPMFWIREDRDPSRLAGWPPGTLVRLDEGPDYEDLFHTLLEGGHWVVGRHPDAIPRSRQRRAQTHLFR